MDLARRAITDLESLDAPDFSDRLRRLADRRLECFSR